MDSMARPNIVWLTLESTRADHCSHHGYARDTTPELTRLAEAPDGRVFTECHAHGIWTRSSSASILTGTHPSYHTVGLDMESRLPDEVSTVAELLREVGFTTACLSPNPNLSSASGLDRGFDRFSYISSSTLLRECSVRSLVKFGTNIRRHSAGLTPQTRKHSFGYLLNELAKEWTTEFAAGDSPYFLYLHYPDTHHPYYPPKPFQDQFTGDLSMSGAEAAEIALDVYDNMYHHLATGSQLTDRQWEAVHAMYDSQIRYTDHLMGELIGHIRAESDRDVIFVVTADHGDLFGEDNLLTHRFVLHSKLSHVPMVVSGDVPFDGGDVVGHIDVMGSVLAHVGADTSQFQGVDLSRETPDVTVTQRGGEREKGMLRWITDRVPDFDIARFPLGDATSVTDGDHRYQVDERGEKLFQLPSEAELSLETSAVEELVSAHDAFDEKWGQPVTTDQERGKVTAGMQRHLERLGYI